MIHVHIYDEGSKEDDNLVDCRDVYVELIDVDETDPDGAINYKQYGFELDGKWIEIRVPTE